MCAGSGSRAEAVQRETENGADSATSFVSSSSTCWPAASAKTSSAHRCPTLTPDQRLPHHRGMDRRRFLLTTLTGSLVAPLAAAPSVVAQGESKALRIGAVSAGAPRSSPHWGAFAQRLGGLGLRRGPESLHRVPDGRRQIRAFSGAHDRTGPGRCRRHPPRGSRGITPSGQGSDGYVGGLARPGGNVTGVFLRQPELTPKRIELLKELVPKVRRVAILWDAFSGDQLQEVQTVAQAAGLQLQRFEFRDPPMTSTVP